MYIKLCPLKTSLAQSEDEFGATSTREKENDWPGAGGCAMLREESPFLARERKKHGKTA